MHQISTLELGAGPDVRRGLEFWMIRIETVFFFFSPLKPWIRR